MGSKTRKARCTTLCVCGSNTEERSIKFRSILGILPCLILRIWRFRARTKNECTMEYFSMLTIWEPWLLEKIFFFHRFHLASRKRNRGYKIVEIHGKGPIGQEFPIDHYKKGKLQTEFHNLLYTKDDFMWELQGIILLTPLLILQFVWGFDNSWFWKCNTFQVDAMRMLSQYGAYDAR
jgi:hypothetical protein